MPYKKFENKKVPREDCLAVLGDELLSKLEDTAPGFRAFCENLLASHGESRNQSPAVKMRSKGFGISCTIPRKIKEIVHININRCTSLEAKC